MAFTTRCDATTKEEEEEDDDDEGDDGIKVKQYMNKEDRSSQMLSR